MLNLSTSTLNSHLDCDIDYNDWANFMVFNEYSTDFSCGISEMCVCLFDFGTWNFHFAYEIEYHLESHDEDDFSNFIFILFIVRCGNFVDMFDKWK